LSDPKTPDVKLILADIVEPKAPQGAKHVITRKADLCDLKEIDALYNTEFGVPDTVYCFHGIMSRGSEDNFDLGLKVYPRTRQVKEKKLIFRSTLTLFEAC
jgi:hypothetical protein